MSISLPRPQWVLWNCIRPSNIIKLNYCICIIFYMLSTQICLNSNTNLLQCTDRASLLRYKSCDMIVGTLIILSPLCSHNNYISIHDIKRFNLPILWNKCQALQCSLQKEQNSVPAAHLRKIQRETIQNLLFQLDLFYRAYGYIFVGIILLSGSCCIKTVKAFNNCQKGDHIN